MFEALTCYLPVLTHLNHCVKAMNELFCVIINILIMWDGIMLMSLLYLKYGALFMIIKSNVIKKGEIRVSKYTN